MERNKSEIIFEHFKRSYPKITRNVYFWEPAGFLSIFVSTSDGNSYIYDDTDATLRKLNDATGSTEEEQMMEFGFNLRKQMRFSNMSADELSEQTGLSKRMISLYMNGHSSPTFINARKIANALKCSLNEFIDKPTVY